MLIKPKEPKQQSAGIFSQKPKVMPVDLSVVYNDLNEVGRRLKVIEERYSILQNRTQVTEQNMISRNRDLSTEIKTTNLEFHEIKKELEQLKEQILLMIKELKTTAKKDDLKVIEKYLSYWQPIRFVTHNEVEDVVREVIRKINNEDNAE